MVARPNTVAGVTYKSIRAIKHGANEKKKVEILKLCGKLQDSEEDSYRRGKMALFKLFCITFSKRLLKTILKV